MSSLQRLSHELSQAIYCIFLLTFWVPFSFLLAGDSFFLGKYIPYQTIDFPFQNLLILALLALNSLRKEFFEVKKEDILVLLIILSLELFIALFSQNPSVSAFGALGYLSLFFTIPLHALFSKTSKIAFFCFGLGIFLGGIFCVMYPEISNPSIIGVSSLLFMIKLFNENSSRQWFFPFLLIIWTLNALLGNTAPLMVFFLLWIGINLWSAKGFYRPQISEWNTGIFFLFTLILTLFIKGGVAWALPSKQIFTLWRQIPHTWIWGVGERQFFQIFAQKDFISFTPNVWRLPHSDLLITFFEKGILGLLIPLLIIFYAFKRNKSLKKVRILIAVFLLFFSQGLWTTPLGLTFLGLILFS